MSSNVIKLFPVLDIPHCLRNLADNIDSGALAARNCTVQMDDMVYHMGTLDDDKATTEAIYDMTYGIHRVLACRDSARKEL